MTVKFVSSIQESRYLVSYFTVYVGSSTLQPGPVRDQQNTLAVHDAYSKGCPPGSSVKIGGFPFDLGLENII